MTVSTKEHKKEEDKKYEIYIQRCVEKEKHITHI
jgi:hypothetical protein